MVERILLSNGVRIVFEHIDHVRSVSLGIWVGAGSRHEAASESGASHFIEHMVFKGTKTRTANELAELMDAIGGQVNAFTTKECTCFHGRVLDTHLGQLTDILSDMFFNSKLDEADVVNERGVILEEIDMYNDTPEDLVSERLFAQTFRGNSLARPILGKKSTLERMTGEFLSGYLSKRYGASEVVVALSGSFTEDDLKMLSERFSRAPESADNAWKAAAYTPSVSLKRKSLEQNHIVLAFPGISATDERRHAMQLLSDILGGGMSSRLFQEVREARGLCYSIYSYGSSYRDTGLFSVYTALGAQSQDEALEVISREVRRLRDTGVTEQELSRAREQVKANVLMALESTSARMNRLGRNELYFGKIPTADEIIASYDAVSTGDILALARDCLDFDRVSFGAVGKLDTERDWLAVVGGA
jgi:predicted Zn-dependent peptidase